MRPVVIVLALVGIVLVAVLLLWPSDPPTDSKPGYRPALPDWLAWMVPDPPAAIPFSSTPPPATLASGASWNGRFTAENGELGVVRIHLTSGPSLKVTASEPGEEEQVLCIVAAGAARPGGCDDDNMADGDSGGVIVRKGVAAVRIEAPAGSVRLAVNE